MNINPWEKNYIRICYFKKGSLEPDPELMVQLQSNLVDNL